MQKRIETIPNTIQSFKVSLNKQEQYSKRNCLLIHGLPESKNENNDQIVIASLKEKTGEEIKKVDLDWTHKLGAPKEGKVRPMIVKFARGNTRRVFRTKNRLKGKKDSITENLTKMRMEAFKEACEGFEFHVWT